MSVYVLPDVLSPTACETARALFPPPRRAAINRDDATGAVDAGVRRSRASFLTEETPASRELAALIYKVLQQANERAFHFEISGAEPLQLAEYAEGDGYHWHLDLGPGSASRRKLSASMQLSDPKAYSGGDLEMWGSGAADREQGAVIVFPSYLLHRVAPIVHGVRHSLVCWAIDKTPFR